MGFGVLSVRGLEFRVDGVSGISGFRIGHPSRGWVGSELGQGLGVEISRGQVHVEFF